jgi:hypothetical protein
MTKFPLTPRVDLSPMADPASALNAAPITDGMMLIGAPNCGALAGRSVALLNVTV